MAIEKVIDIKVQGNADQAVGSLRSQLREAQAEVAALSDKFGATSAEAAQAARKAAELKDRIGDAKALTDAFNPDAKFKALSSSLSGVAGGFAAAQGGMALFGVESENVQATLLKVQSAMALSQGLQAVGESLDSFKQLGAVIKELNIVKLAFNFIETGQIGLIRANTAAKVQDATATAALATATVTSTAATGFATTALKVFRLALIGTGIGALVLGLVALYQNFDKVKAAVLNLLPGLTDISNFIGGVVDSVTDFVGATSDASRALDKLKSDADATLALNKRFMQEHGDQVDQYTAKKIAAKNAYLEAIKEDGANVAALGQRLNRELAAIDKEREDKRKEARDKVQKEEKAAAEKLRDIRVSAYEKDKTETIKQSEEIDELTYNFRKGTVQKIALVNTESITARLKEQQAAAKKSEEIEKENAESTEKIEKEKAAARMAYLSAGSTALKNAANLAGEATDTGKALAVAAATIDTYQSAVSSYNSLSGIPIVGPALGFAAAGVAVAAGLANVKKILAVKTPKGGGGGAAPSGGAGGSTTPPQFNVVGATGVNQLAGVMGAQQQTPVQAYVVANNVTTAQSLDRNIISSATLGG